jgi:hypothetical protein
VITIYGQIDPALPSDFTVVNTASISALRDNTPSNNVSSVVLGGQKVYLPLVVNRWPPVPNTPALNAISNSGGNSYTVSWSSADQADTYTLQEDDNSSFSSLTTVYGPGTALSWQATNKAAGTYYYRVKASNSYGDSGWSNVQSVTVSGSSGGPTPGFWQSGTGDEFYVSSDSAQVNNFAIYVNLPGCASNYKITNSAPALISNDQFSFSGSFYASGMFNSSTTASGQDGLTHYGPVCGSYWRGGPWSWSATWQHSAQAVTRQAYRVATEDVKPDEAPDSIDTVTPIR